MRTPRGVEDRRGPDHEGQAPGRTPEVGAGPEEELAHRGGGETLWRHPGGGVKELRGSGGGGSQSRGAPTFAGRHRTPVREHSFDEQAFGYKRSTYTRSLAGACHHTHNREQPRRPPSTVSRAPVSRRSHRRSRSRAPVALALALALTYRWRWKGQYRATCALRLFP